MGVVSDHVRGAKTLGKLTITMTRLSVAVSKHTLPGLLYGLAIWDKVITSKAASVTVDVLRVIVDGLLKVLESLPRGVTATVFTAYWFALALVAMRYANKVLQKNVGLFVHEPLKVMAGMARQVIWLLRRTLPSAVSVAERAHGGVRGVRGEGPPISRSRARARTRTRVHTASL